MQKLIIKIPGMDCPSEEKLIRMALENLDQIEHLDFDLQSRTLVAYHGNNSKEILDKLESLNFGAKEVSSSELSEDEKNDLNLLIDNSKLNEKSEAKVLWILLSLNGLMFGAELVYGFIAQSAGLIADAMDMFADAGVYGVSLYAVGKSASLKRTAAKVSGYAQLILASLALIETVRRFILGSSPGPLSMIYVSLVALLINVICLILITRQKSDGVHMRASAIFSANDVIVNLGVIAAAILVYYLESPIPDLIVGIIISIVVLKGSLKILKISNENLKGEYINGSSSQSS